MRRTTWVSLVALFTALSVVLNGFTVPAPYAGFLLYGLWEIPVVLALLMLGVRGGVVVAGLNALALEFINPGSLPTGPLYNLVAEVAMFAGILAAARTVPRSKGAAILVASATASGAALRTAVMTVVNWVVLPQPFPIGYGSFGVTPAAVPPLLVVIAVFNATTVLYVVPAAYAALKAISSRSRIPGAAPGQAFTP